MKGKKGRKILCDVILSIMLNRKKEEMNEEFSVIIGKRSTVRRFDGNIRVFGKDAPIESYKILRV